MFGTGSFMFAFWYKELDGRAGVGSSLEPDCKGLPSEKLARAAASPALTSASLARAGSRGASVAKLCGRNHGRRTFWSAC